LGLQARNSDGIDLADTPGKDPVLAAMSEIAQEAGVLAMTYFEAGAATSARIDYKHGGSPVSEADLAVDVLLRQRLSPLAPDAGWLSEETADSPERLQRRQLFIVDPIDGTRAFIKGDPRWSISIALVESGRPCLAVLHLPALNETFEAAEGAGATLNGRKLATSGRASLAGSRLGGPLGILDALTGDDVEIVREPRVPSLAYRMARVAAGEIDGGIASADAWDWDVAAADLIVREAGGSFTGLDGQTPLYNAQRPRHGILAAAPAAMHGDLLAALRRAIAKKQS
jgi:myo-inositol-1(or 4)-monophosphatase